MEILNKKFFNKNKSAFTLVELIIVITILAILATIAFISFQGYSKNARDGNRLSTMKNISKGLEIYQVQTGNYPKPDTSFNVEASGTLIGYQGIIGDSLSKLINISKTPIDPFDSSNYLYSVSLDNKKYQLLGYLETTDYLSLLNQSYAVDYSNRYVKTIGDKVGVILDSNKAPISGVAKVEVATGSTVYNVYFGDNDLVNGSGNTLFSNMYTRRKDLTNNKNLASLDSSLVGYWDMETLTGGKLKDLSKYGNNGTLNGGLQVGGIDGVKGKATYFDGSKYISLASSIKNSSIYSVCVWVNNNSNGIYSYYTESVDFDGLQTYLSIQVRNSKSTVFASDNIGWKSTFSNINLDLSYWNFVCLSNNNTNVSFYLNGKYINSGNIPITSVSSTYGNIGLGFIGYIDDFRIYNRALSDPEIQELYNSTK